MRNSFTIALFSALLLSACQGGAIGGTGSPAWHMTATPEEKNRAYTERCISFGFELGTTAMAQCRMQVAQDWSSKANRRMDNLSRAYQPRPQVTCQTIGTITTCR